jgi:hypothetical protein
MRVSHAVILSVALSLPAAAQDAFDACATFTQEDAEKAAGTSMAGEPVNPKAKRPKVVLNCTYTGSKDAKAVAATAQFKFLRTPEEATKAFEDARLQYQTKPMLMPGAETFWSGKTGQMHMRKGRAVITLSVGPAKPGERDIEQAKKLAELLIKKL